MCILYAARVANSILFFTQIEELEMEISALRNEKQDLLRENREKGIQIGHLRAGQRVS